MAESVPDDLDDLRLKAALATQLVAEKNQGKVQRLPSELMDYARSLVARRQENEASRSTQPVPPVVHR